MGLLGEIIGDTKNVISQGIQGAKAIQPYINEKYSGLVSAVKNSYNGFVNDVKSIPTLLHDMLHFRTFANDVKNGMKYAASKKSDNELNGKPHSSYYQDVKDGYRISKLDRTNPLFHNRLRQYLGLKDELPYDKEKQKELDRIKQLRKVINVRRMTISDDMRLSLDKKRNRKKA